MFVVVVGVTFFLGGGFFKPISTLFLHYDQVANYSEYPYTHLVEERDVLMVSKNEEVSLHTD